MLHLLLTLDYEVFGNGSGDVLRDVVEPTERILDICDRYGAKLTIMFEVAEYWSLMEAERSGVLRLPYSPSGRMREQAQMAIQRGHDVQLHLHPQWIGAEFQDGRWVVTPTWRLADLPHGIGCADDLLSVTGALAKGKSTLDAMLQRIVPSYQCMAFRAGGFFAQPSKPVIQAMRAVGLKADSSVVPGRKRDWPWQCDYTKAPTVPYWWTNAHDSCTIGEPGEGLLEYPVRVIRRPYLANFKPRKLLTTIRRRRLERGDACKAEDLAPRLGWRHAIGKLFTVQPCTLDFCKLTCNEMIMAVERMLKTSGGRSIAPLTLIGHSKDFWNDEHFKRFLSMVRSMVADGKSLAFRTLSDSVAEIGQQDQCLDPYRAGVESA